MRFVSLIGFALFCTAVSSASASIIDIKYTGSYVGSQTTCAIGGNCSSAVLDGQFALTLEFNTSGFGSIVTSTAASVTLAEPFSTTGNFYTDGGLAFGLNSLVTASDSARMGATDQHLIGITTSKTTSFTPTVDISVTSALIPASIITPFYIDTGLNGSGTVVGPSYVGNFGSGGTIYNLTPETLLVMVDGVGAVPEPATWALFILGFICIGFVARRVRWNLNPNVGSAPRLLRG